MNLQEIYQRIDPLNFRALRVALQINTNNTNSDDSDLDVGQQDFFCINPYVSAIDTDGDPVEIVTTRDLFTLQINTDGNEMFIEPVELFSLNSLHKNPLFKGFLMPRLTRYNFAVQGQGHPSASKLNYPLKIYIDLYGYKLPIQQQG